MGKVQDCGVSSFVSVGSLDKPSASSESGSLRVGLGRAITMKLAKTEFKIKSFFRGVVHTGKNIIKRAVVGGFITSGIGATATGCAVFLTSFIAATTPIALLTAVTAAFASAGAWAVPGLVGGACKPLIERAIVHWYVQPALEKQAKELRGSRL